MSIEAMRHVWQHSTQKGSALVVLLAVADMADDHGDCWPGVAYLAKKCRLSERGLQKITEHLKTTGELEIDLNKGMETKTGRTNLYRLVGVNDSSSLHESGEPQFTPGMNGSTPHPPEGVNASTPLGVNASSPDPSVDPSDKRDPTIDPIAASPDGEQPQGDEPPSDPLPVTPSSKKRSPRKPKPRDPVYDLLAEVWFDKQPGTPAFAALGGRIGSHVSWVKGNDIHVTREGAQLDIPGCPYPVSREQLQAARKAWYEKNPEAHHPLEICKFVEFLDPWLEEHQPQAPSEKRVDPLFNPEYAGLDLWGTYDLSMKKQIERLEKYGGIDVNHLDHTG